MTIVIVALLALAAGILVGWVANDEHRDWVERYRYERDNWLEKGIYEPWGRDRLAGIPQPDNPEMTLIEPDGIHFHRDAQGILRTGPAPKDET